MSVRDALADVLADTLNQKFKYMKVADFLDGSDRTATDVEEYGSRDSCSLDLARAKKPNGGIAVGRSTGIMGFPSSAATLVGDQI